MAWTRLRFERGPGQLNRRLRFEVSLRPEYGLPRVDALAEFLQVGANGGGDARSDRVCEREILDVRQGFGDFPDVVGGGTERVGYADVDGRAVGVPAFR